MARIAQHSPPNAIERQGKRCLVSKMASEVDPQLYISGNPEEETRGQTGRFPTILLRKKRRKVASTVEDANSHERRFGKKITSPKDCVLNPVGCRGIVLRNETPNVEEIGYSLRRELITAHPWRGLSECARFNSVSLARTASASINSPRWAAA